MLYLADIFSSFDLCRIQKLTNPKLSNKSAKTTGIFTSNYPIVILTKLFQGFRPIQITKDLGVSPQLVNYHMDKLDNFDLIEKIGNRYGIAWVLTEKGNFILKEIMTGSVNGHHLNGNTPTVKVPIRFHQLTFAFRITSPVIGDLNLDWKQMRNGVSKAIIKKIDEEASTIELVKSPIDGNSTLLIHMREVHTFDIFKEIIRLYEASRNIAQIVANDLHIEISGTGELIKKPDLAFEKDPIALYLASYECASINTSKKGQVWIDESHGTGEIETNDVDYAYKYLIMPEIIMEIHYLIGQILKRNLLPFPIPYYPIF